VLPAGTALEVELPDAGGAVRARVVRCGDGLLGVVSPPSRAHSHGSIGLSGC
jgi:hypothetical protein